MVLLVDVEVVVVVLVVDEVEVVVVIPVTSQSTTTIKSARFTALPVSTICNCKTSLGPIITLLATARSRLVLAAKPVFI